MITNCTVGSETSAQTLLTSIAAGSVITIIELDTTSGKYCIVTKYKNQTLASYTWIQSKEKLDEFLTSLSDTWEGISTTLVHSNDILITSITILHPY